MSSGLVARDVALTGGPVLQEPGTYYNTMHSAVLGSASPITLMIIAVVVVLFLGFSTYLGTVAEPPQYSASQETGALNIITWGFVIFLVLANGLQYVFGTDIAAGIDNLFAPVPEIDIALSPADAPILEQEADTSGAPIPEIMAAKQVFHVPGNKYTYRDAKALCKAYDARLARYDEIENAYNTGGEWCSYGWSADQLALFPTQKSTYDALSKIEGHKNDCGRPGVNGGYIDNPKVRFGVNCYGHRPVITPKEQKAMQSHSSYPLTHEEIVLDKKAAKYRAKLSGIEVSPFNGTTWSRV
jgi:hypothetical protein